MRKTIWTKEACFIESVKYKTRGEFRSKSRTAYFKCVKEKWLDDLCVHMISPIKPKKYWNLDTCKKEALKYKTRSDFGKAKGWAYRYALLNGFLDDICSHMITVGNFKKRCVYAYEFENNNVYVGLTHDLNERWSRRLNDKKDSVTLFMKKTNLKPKTIKLTDYIDKDEASKLEGVYLNEYIKKGWNILNKIKTGSLGGSVITKWTKEECKNEALKYKTFLDFKNKNINCLSAIYKHQWNKELLKHLKYGKFPNGYWNKKRCLEKALECNKRTEFYKKHRGAYASAKKNNWMNDICKHMN